MLVIEVSHLDFMDRTGLLQPTKEVIKIRGRLDANAHNNFENASESNNA